MNFNFKNEFSSNFSKWIIFLEASSSMNPVEMQEQIQRMEKKKKEKES